MNATKCSLKYAKGKTHISGLDEIVSTGMDSLNYSKSACSALTRSSFWITRLPTNDLRLALEGIRSTHYGTGPCAKCEKTALAQLAAEVGCPNPWHVTSGARMTSPCAECKRCPNPWHAEAPGRARMWCCPPCPTV